jgi:hypothetical protein
MTLPAAAVSALNKLKQGPVQVLSDPGGADEVELFVRDGVDLTFLRGQAEAAVDILGVYDIFTTGDHAEFEIRAPERSLSILKVVYQDVTSGLHGALAYFGFGKSAGTSLRATAKEFRFRPWQSRATETDSVVLWLCVPTGDAKLAQGTTDPHMWSQTFRALPDVTKADGQLIGRIYAEARS